MATDEVTYVLDNGLDRLEINEVPRRLSSDQSNSDEKGEVFAGVGLGKSRPVCNGTLAEGFLGVHEHPQYL